MDGLRARGELPTSVPASLGQPTSFHAKRAGRAGSAGVELIQGGQYVRGPKPDRVPYIGTERNTYRHLVKALL